MFGCAFLNGYPEKDRRARYYTRPAVVAIALALSACAPHPRYISTYCLSHDQQLPAEPPKVHDKLTGQADKDIGIIAGSAIRLRAWGEGLQDILEHCREPAK